MPDLSRIKEDCQPGKQCTEKLSFNEAQIWTFPDKQQSREFIPCSLFLGDMAYMKCKRNPLR